MMNLIHHNEIFVFFGFLLLHLHIIFFVSSDSGVLTQLWLIKVYHVNNLVYSY
jgi:hypothetical protein